MRVILAMRYRDAVRACDVARGVHAIVKADSQAPGGEGEAVAAVWLEDAAVANAHRLQSELLQGRLQRLLREVSGDECFVDADEGDPSTLAALAQLDDAASSSRSRRSDSSTPRTHTVALSGADIVVFCRPSPASGAGRQRERSRSGPTNGRRVGIGGTGAAQRQLRFTIDCATARVLVDLDDGSARPIRWERGFSDAVADFVAGGTGSVGVDEAGDGGGGVGGDASRGAAAAVDVVPLELLKRLQSGAVSAKDLATPATVRRIVQQLHAADAVRLGTGTLSEDADAAVQLLVALVRAGREELKAATTSTPVALVARALAGALHTACSSSYAGSDVALAMATKALAHRRSFLVNFAACGGVSALCALFESSLPLEGVGEGSGGWASTTEGATSTASPGEQVIIPDVRVAEAQQLRSFPTRQLGVQPPAPLGHEGRDGAPSPSPASLRVNSPATSSVPGRGAGVTPVAPALFQPPASPVVASDGASPCPPSTPNAAGEAPVRVDATAPAGEVGSALPRSTRASRRSELHKRMSPLRAYNARSRSGSRLLRRGSSDRGLLGLVSPQQRSDRSCADDAATKLDNRMILQAVVSQVATSLALGTASRLKPARRAGGGSPLPPPAESPTSEGSQPSQRLAGSGAGGWRELPGTAVAQAIAAVASHTAAALLDTHSPRSIDGPTWRGLLRPWLLRRRLVNRLWLECLRISTAALPRQGGRAQGRGEEEESAVSTLVEVLAPFAVVAHACSARAPDAFVLRARNRIASLATYFQGEVGIAHPSWVGHVTAVLKVLSRYVRRYVCISLVRHVMHLCVEPLAAVFPGALADSDGHDDAPAEQLQRALSSLVAECVLPLLDAPLHSSFLRPLQDSSTSFLHLFRVAGLRAPNFASALHTLQRAGLGEAVVSLARLDTGDAAHAEVRHAFRLYLGQAVVRLASTAEEMPIDVVASAMPLYSSMRHAQPKSAWLPFLQLAVRHHMRAVLRLAHQRTSMPLLVQHLRCVRALVGADGRVAVTTCRTGFVGMLLRGVTSLAAASAFAAAAEQAENSKQAATGLPLMPQRVTSLPPLVLAKPVEKRGGGAIALHLPLGHTTTVVEGEEGGETSRVDAGSPVSADIVDSSASGAESDSDDEMEIGAWMGKDVAPVKKPPAAVRLNLTIGGPSLSKPSMSLGSAMSLGLPPKASPATSPANSPPTSPPLRAGSASGGGTRPPLPFLTPGTRSSDGGDAEELGYSSDSGSTADGFEIGSDCGSAEEAGGGSSASSVISRPRLILPNLGRAGVVASTGDAVPGGTPVVPSLRLGASGGGSGSPAQSPGLQLDLTSWRDTARRETFTQRTSARSARAPMSSHRSSGMISVRALPQQRLRMPTPTGSLMHGALSFADMRERTDTLGSEGAVGQDDDHSGGAARHTPVSARVVAMRHQVGPASSPGSRSVDAATSRRLARRSSALGRLEGSQNDLEHSVDRIAMLAATVLNPSAAAAAVDAAWAGEGGEAALCRAVMEDAEVRCEVVALLLELLFDENGGMLRSLFRYRYPLREHTESKGGGRRASVLLQRSARAGSSTPAQSEGHAGAEAARAPALGELRIAANVPFVLHVVANSPAGVAVLPFMLASVIPAARDCSVLLRAIRLLSSTLFGRAKRLVRSRELAAGAFGRVVQCTIDQEDDFEDSEAWMSWPRGQAGIPGVHGLMRIGERSARLVDLTGTKVAAKVIKTPNTQEARCVLADVATEVSILEDMAVEGHREVVKLIDYGLTNEAYWLVLELTAGNAREWRRGALPAGDGALLSDGEWRLCLRLFYCVARAVEQLHDAGVAHFDLKLANVLLRRHPTADDGVDALRDLVCVTDFGEAMYVPGRHAAEVCTDRSRGTDCIKSPEMLRVGGQARHGKAGGAVTRVSGASDVWSLGCLLYELVTGEYLFHTDDWGRFFVTLTGASDDAVADDMEAPLGQPHRAQLLDALRFMLVRDPNARPTAAEVRQYMERVARRA